MWPSSPPTGRCRAPSGGLLERGRPRGRLSGSLLSGRASLRSAGCAGSCPLPGLPSLPRGGPGSSCSPVCLQQTQMSCVMAWGALNHFQCPAGQGLQRQATTIRAVSCYWSPCTTMCPSAKRQDQPPHHFRVPLSAGQARVSPGSTIATLPRIHARASATGARPPAIPDMLLVRAPPAATACC